MAFNILMVQMVVLFLATGGIYGWQDNTNVYLKYCNSFKGKAIYSQLNLGDFDGCDANVFPQDDGLCLADPRNPEQALDFTCKSLEELYIG